MDIRIFLAYDPCASSPGGDERTCRAIARKGCTTMKDTTIHAHGTGTAEEKKEIIANIGRLATRKSIHHLVIVTRTLLRIEKEQRGG